MQTGIALHSTDALSCAQGPATHSPRHVCRDDHAKDDMPPPPARVEHFVRVPWYKFGAARYQPACPRAREYHGTPLAIHLDDIANALSISTVAHGSQAAGNAAMRGILLGAGWLLSWSMGTWPALRITAGAPAILSRLRGDMAQVALRRDPAQRAEAGLYATQNLDAWSRMLRQQHSLAISRAVFSGIAAGLGTFLTGGAAGLELVAMADTRLEGAALWGLRVGAPLMGMFALGASGNLAHRLIKALRQGRVARGLTPLPGHEALVTRCRQVQAQSVGFAASLLGMGVGIQWVAFFDARGIWLLIAGVVGMCVASYLEHAYMCHHNPMTLDERLQLGDDASILDLRQFAKVDCELLASLTAHRRHTLAPAWRAPWQIREGRPPWETVSTYLRLRAGSEASTAPDPPGDTGTLDGALTLTPLIAFCDAHKLSTPFALAVANDTTAKAPAEPLHACLQLDARNPQVDFDVLEARCRHDPSAARRVFTLAERMLVRVFAREQRSRQRELCDVLLDRALARHGSRRA